MVFQSYALLPHLSSPTTSPSAFRCAARRRPRWRSRLDKVAALLGLKPLLRRKPGQLSGGQQQRVALGRALIAEAPVCLLDEPLSNLDAQLRQDLRREIRALQQRLGITMIYVTHDQTEAMSMADRVILMHAGKHRAKRHAGRALQRPASFVCGPLHRRAPMSLLDLDDGPRGAVIAGTAGPELFAARPDAAACSGCGRRTCRG